MSRRRFMAWNGASAALTAFLVPVTTGASIKTMLQLKPATPIAIIEWGYSFDVVPTAAVKVELITTGTVFANVTSFAAGDLIKYDDSGGAASTAIITANTSGFTSSSEGTVTASRFLDGGLKWAQEYSKQFPLDREPGVAANDCLRVRVTTAVAINMLTYVVWEE